MELGPAALSSEENWFTICTMRSTEVRKIEGGMSALTSEILKAMFVIAQLGGWTDTSGLLLLGFSGMLRPFELVALTYNDMTFITLSDLDD